MQIVWTKHADDRCQEWQERLGITLYWTNQFKRYWKENSHEI